jgi:hypothetical protein
MQLDGKNDPTLYEWEAAGLKDIGMAWNRTLTPGGGQFRWSDIQFNQGAPYNWDITDAFVKQAQAQGIHILALIHPYVSWDQTDKTSYNYGSPHDMDAFKAFVAAVVERYDGDGIDDMSGLLYPIKYYEIGNEPEGVHFNGSYPDNYQGFMETVKAARDAAKTAYPDVKIVIGGTSPIYDNTIDGFNSDVDTFWNNALGVTGATDCFDIFNFHFFVGEYTKDIKDYLDFWKTKLSTYGLSGKPIWLTETGTYSGTVTLSEGAVWPEQSTTYQASWLVKQYAYALANGIDKLFSVFYYSDQTDWRSYVAMVNIDKTTKKPVYYTHKQMAEKIDGFSSVVQNAYDASGGQDKTSGNIKFVVDNTPVYVLWNDQGGTVVLSGISSPVVKMTKAVPTLDANGNATLDQSGNPTFETYTTAVSNGQVSISVSSRPVYVEESGWIYSNSVGSRNTVKVTDLSGSLSSSGASIMVKAWDANGNALTESSSAASLKLYSHGTTTIAGSDLAARFPGGSPLLYALAADSSKYIITNVKSSSDGTLNVPNGYTSGTTKFVSNSVGPRNAIKITDMSGTLATPASITVAAWNADGVSIPESTSATPLTLSSHGTTTITGTELAARFPTGTPMSYEFTVDTSKYVITNVKSSSDGSINIPYAYMSGSSNFVANSIGPRNTIKISDVSGSLASSGAAITISAWDVNGNALSESTGAAALKLYSRGTTSITGSELAARFPGGTPMAYEFTVGSSKYIITNTKSSTDGSINIPAVYTSGTTAYASNDISSRSTIKMTDASGTLSSSGAAITVAAWDMNGNTLAESGSATPLTLYSNGTTSITGTELAARFPTGTPVLYEFTVGSAKYLITNVTSNTAGTLTIPSVYGSGVAGGI